MAKASFAQLKEEFDEACAFLRGFTLAHPGFFQRSGVAGIERVNDVCDRLSKLFASGPHAGKATALVASGRTRVRAAEVRLALLRSRRKK